MTVKGFKKKIEIDHYGKTVKARSELAFFRYFAKYFAKEGQKSRKRSVCNRTRAHALVRNICIENAFKYMHKLFLHHLKPDGVIFALQIRFY